DRRGAALILLSIALVVVKVVSEIVYMATPNPVKPWWFIGTVNYIPAIIHLLAFENYLYITKSATKEILKSSIAVTNHTAKQTAHTTNG
ncbi:hypothetical protein BKA69DRAFT_1104627, partial [Paraphysoderma sedebokerense]